MRGVAYRIMVLGAALGLAACPSLPRRAPAVEAWAAHRSQLQQREHFELRGRVAVAAGEEGFSASLRWQQQGSHTRLALEGPFGAGGLEVDWDGAVLSMHNARGQVLDGEAARAELHARLGFEPPLSSLRYWLLGVPSPAGFSEEVLDAQQRLASLTQDGWRVDYAGYTDAAGQWLPQRVNLHREGARVRLLVEHWDVP